MYPDEKLIKVSKMYYELGLTQKEISQRLNYSRPTISRMLDAAMKRGIVKVSVQYPINSLIELAEEIKRKFNLKKVFVAPSYIDDYELIKNDVGKALANFLSDIVQTNDILGVSWGTTLSSVPQFLPQTKKDIEIVQLNGGISKNSISTGSIDLLERFAKAFSADFHLLSVPTIVDNEEIAQAILEDSSINDVIELGRKCNIALFGIGKTSYDNILYEGGYFSKDYYERLMERGAVGDICSRYFNIRGEIVEEELNQRTIGLQLKDLHEKDYSIAMAIGEDKTKAVYGALKGNYVNTLFIDETIARSLMTFEEEY